MAIMIMKLKGKMMQRWPPKVDLSFRATLVNHSVCKLYCAKLSGAKHYCTKLYCAKNLSVYNSVQPLCKAKLYCAKLYGSKLYCAKPFVCSVQDYTVHSSAKKYFMVY